MATTNPGNDPKPNLIAEAQRIRAEHGYPMNKCLRLATEIVREWGIRNGYLD